MGVSNNAYLAFGVDLGEDAFQDEDFDLEDFLLKRAEVNDPYTGYPPEIDQAPYPDRDRLYNEWKATQPNWDERVKTYFEQRDALIKACPVEIIIHCSYDYPMYILALRDTDVSAARGYPKVIDPAALKVDPARIEEAKEFCKDADLPAFDDPQWLIFSQNR